MSDARDEARGLLPHATVLVFARAAEHGRVKTRLARTLGDDATLRLYRAFLADTLRSARESGAQVFLAHTPAPDVPEVARVDRSFEQVGADFGARLDHALAETRRHAPEGPLVVIGADAPQLSPGDLRTAFLRLADHPVALGPSRGGGFYLLGVRDAPLPCAAALARPNEAAAVAELYRRDGRPPALLAPGFDVDVEQDLIELLSWLELARQCPGTWIPGATAAVLAELALHVVPAGGDSNRDLRLAVG